jgi:hypothetical protein
MLCTFLCQDLDTYILFWNDIIDYQLECFVAVMNSDCFM